ARGATVAVKVLHDEKNEARLSREAAILAELRHPGIVRYVDHGLTEDGRGFLVMEWLDGEDLALRLQRGPMGLDDAVEVLRRAGAALAAAHARGVVHRDL